MSWFTALMVYAILWWLVLFMVLPWGVHTPDEVGEESEPGHVRSAPVRPRLWVKAAVTTAIAAAVFAIGFGIIASGLFDLRDYFRSAIR